MYCHQISDATRNSQIEVNRANRQYAIDQIKRAIKCLQQPTDPGEIFTFGPAGWHLLGKSVARLMDGTTPTQHEAIELMHGFTHQLKTQQEQQELAKLCGRAYTISLGYKYTELQKAFLEQEAALIHPDVNPDNFPFTPTDKEHLVPVSLLTVIESCQASDIPAMISDSRSYTPPDLAHAFSFAIRYSHVVKETNILIPCTPWDHPHTGPTVLIIEGSATGPIKSSISTYSTNHIVTAFGPLILVAGKNRHAVSIPSNMSGYPDSPKAY